MARKPLALVLGNINANIPGDVFAYGRGDAPGSAAIAKARLRNATPRSVEEWLAKNRIKSKAATVHVVQLSPFDRSIIGSVEYKVLRGGVLQEVRRTR